MNSIFLTLCFLCICSVSLHPVASYARPCRAREVSNCGSALPAPSKLHGPVVVLRDDGSPAATWQREEQAVQRWVHQHLRWQWVLSLVAPKGNDRRRPDISVWIYVWIGDEAMNLKSFLRFEWNTHLMTNKCVALLDLMWLLGLGKYQRINRYLPLRVSSDTLWSTEKETRQQLSSNQQAKTPDQPQTLTGRWKTNCFPMKLCSAETSVLSFIVEINIGSVATLQPSEVLMLHWTKTW